MPLHVFTAVWYNRGKSSFKPSIAMSRFVVFLSICTSFIILGSFAVLGQRPGVPPQTNQAISPVAAQPARQISQAQRIREGTPFRNKHVFFQQIGDRTALYTVDEHRRFMCLENLHLERILTAMQENPERVFWSIDGDYTEFRGENYVLIRRAVVARPPAANL